MFRDQFHDPAHGTLHNLLARHPQAADFLKHAEIEDAPPNLPDTAYAWGSKKLYPIHEPHHAVLSSLYAHRDEAPAWVQEKIAEALDAYNINKEILLPSAEKVAYPEGEECIFPEERIYPVRTPEETKTAEAQLLAQLPRMNFERRKVAFARLEKAAAFHSVKLSAESYKLAGATASDPNELAYSLRGRASACNDPALKEKFLKLSMAVKGDPRALENANVQRRLVDAVAGLDKQAGFSEEYSRRFFDPFRTVHNTTKIAAPTAVSLGGKGYSHADLARVPLDLYKTALGDDVAREIAPGGQVDPGATAQLLETLPADMKLSFARHLRNAGL